MQTVQQIDRAASRIELRDYQQAAIDAVREAWSRGVRRPLIALPTGCGKTIIFAELLRQRRQRGRSLVLAHRTELLEQARDKLLLADPTADVGVVQAASDEGASDIVVASVQTLVRPRRLARLGGGFANIVIDEAHHAPAPSYHKVLGALGAFGPTKPLVLGVTATPSRSDGVALGGVFEGIVYSASIEEMIRQQYLANLRAVQVRLQLDLGDVPTQAGDYAEEPLGRKLLDANAPGHVLAAYQQHAPDRTALVFVPSVAVAHAMAATFRDGGVAAESIDGNTPREERRAILHRLRSGETPVVVNCAVLVEGFDEPRVDCIIVARPTKSRLLYQQMVGRGTRLHPAKTDCVILDCVGVTTRLELVTAASLFGVQPDELAHQGLTHALAQRDRAATMPDAMPGHLVARTIDLFERRPLRWLPAGEGWVLPLRDGQLHLVPERDSEQWRIVQQPRYGGAQVLQQGLPLDYAQGIAEGLVRTHGVVHLADPRAAWRAHPASAKQRELLRRRGVPVPPRLTKGEASDLLARLLAGGSP